MSIARRYLYLILSLAIGAAAPIAAQSQPASFVPLPEFVAAVRNARHADFAASPHFAVASPVEFETMSAHLLAQYQGVTATHSFLIGTQYVDCVPIMQQPAVRQLGLTTIAAPPPPPPVNTSKLPPVGTVQPLLSMGLTDAFGNAMQCDKGTIPMLRVTLEDLSRFPTLRSFFAKKPPPPTAPSITCNQNYRYAVGLDTVAPPYYGAQTTLAIWYPAINPSYGLYQHSISQMWVEGLSSTSPLQTAEAGWTVDPTRTNTSAATLFVYWTSSNYFDGCYNLDCGAFVQRSHRWVLGTPNWPGPSVPGQQNQVFFGPLQWELYQGNWWLYRRGSERSGPCRDRRRQGVSQQRGAVGAGAGGHPDLYQ